MTSWVKDAVRICRPWRRCLFSPRWLKVCYMNAGYFSKLYRRGEPRGSVTRSRWARCVCRGRSWAGSKRRSSVRLEVLWFVVAEAAFFTEGVFLFGRGAVEWMDVGAHFIANEAIYYKNFLKYKSKTFTLKAIKSPHLLWELFKISKMTATISNNLSVWVLDKKKIGIFKKQNFIWFVDDRHNKVDMIYK